MIPYLAAAPFVVVIGPEANTALARLRVSAASTGISCTEFGPSVFVEPASYAAIMKATARELRRPVLHAPLPGHSAPLIAAADLVVVAPPGVGNRVWLLTPDDGEAFSICLPEFDRSTCPFITELLLERRIVLADEELARPSIRFARSYEERMAPKIWMAMPTHIGTGAVH